MSELLELLVLAVELTKASREPRCQSVVAAGPLGLRQGLVRDLAHEVGTELPARGPNHQQVFGNQAIKGTGGVVLAPRTRHRDEGFDLTCSTDDRSILEHRALASCQGVEPSREEAT